MKFQGFIGPAYTLDSVNVDAQDCINMYPEMIESGDGKEAQVKYLRSTPGLAALMTVGDGPIRMIHVDSVGRILVASGNKLYWLTDKSRWLLFTRTANSGQLALTQDSSHIDTTGYVLTSSYVDVDVAIQAFTFTSSVTLPTGISADTTYWTIPDGDDGSGHYKYKLATSLANALAGTAIPITDVGSGNLTAWPVLGAVAGSFFDIQIDSDINYSTGTITRTAHGYYTGMPILMKAMGTLPTEIVDGTTYYVIKISADTFQLATSIANASAGTAMTLTEASGNWVANLLPYRTWSSTSAKTFDTSTGRISAGSMSPSGDGTDSSTVMSDGSRNYRFYFDTITGEFSFDYNYFISEGDVGEGPTFSHVVFIDGYLIVNKLNTGNFFVSDVQSLTFSSLSFAASEGSPDLVIGLMDNYRALWVFNERSTEIYEDTGNADFPFERIQGGFLEIGCLAKYSIAKIGGTVFWLGRTEYGRGVIYAASGINPKRVSTHAVEQAISGYADPSSATSYTYESNGHLFYVLNFTEATWVYDLSTGLWHKRAYTNAGVLERHRGEFHAYAPDQSLHLVGDYSDNNIFYFDDATYSDNGNEITRLRAAPHISSELDLVFCSKFQLDMETGIGLVSGQGSDPQVVLQWSDDGGHTWSSESWTSAGGQAGGIGEYKTRVIWRRLGSFRDRVFRVKMTDPVKWNIIDAQIELLKGTG